VVELVKNGGNNYNWSFLRFLALLELFAFYDAFGVFRSILRLSKRELVFFFDTASILLRSRFDTPSQNSEGVSKKGRSGIEESVWWVLS
jgi:hypothetical protein